MKSMNCYKCILISCSLSVSLFVGINSPSTLTSVPFLTNVSAIVEYRQKKLEQYLQVIAHKTSDFLPKNGD